VAPPVLSTLTRSPAGWKQAVVECVAQQPLMHTRASLEGLRTARHRPAALLMGVGLCTPRQLARAVPLDLLGMLLPAEQLRQASGARELILLVADRHALTSGFGAAAVDRRARATIELLDRLRRRFRIPTRLIRASQFHDHADYRRVLADVAGRLPDDHEYVHRQLADCIHFDREYGGILKIGWTAQSPHRLDEVALDRRLRSLYQGRISFAYCKPGRTVDGRPMPPYVALSPARRVCLEPGEDPARKLARLAASDGQRACRRHLRAIAYSYARQVGLPRGPLERRLAAMIADLAMPAPVAA
jgi:hypothetical protein